METESIASTKKTRPAGRIVPGLLLLLPALFCCTSQLFLPTINTFSMSLQKIRLVGTENMYVGLDNYAILFGNENFWSAVGFTLLTLLVRLFLVALVPPLLAWAVAQFGRPLRLGLRTILTIPMILFVPLAIAITWLVFLNPTGGLLPLGTSWAASPASARLTLLFIDGLYFFGLASGLGLIFYLPLWRRPAGAPQPTFREGLKPMLVTWALGILGIVALTFSTFSLNFAMTNGGPAGSTNSLGILMYIFAFRNFDIGAGAAIASMILLITLVLGIVAGTLMILTGLRLDIIDTKPVLEKTDGPLAPKRSRAFPGIVLALLVLLTFSACLFSTLPFGWLVPQAFGRNGLARLLEQIAAGRVFINTLLPALITATLQVLSAYLAALSIGAIQPLGKRSKWLLLLFSPWLFVTVLPLSPANFMAYQNAGRLEPFLGSLSPILFSIPALFILTIFFNGRASHLQRKITDGGSAEPSNFFKHFVLPSLPLAAVLWLLILFFNGQDVFWPLLVSVSPERYPLSITLLRLAGMLNLADGTLAAAITFFVLPVCFLFLVSLIPFQIFYLDRLSLFTEDLAAEKSEHL